MPPTGTHWELAENEHLKQLGYSSVEAHSQGLLIPWDFRPAHGWGKCPLLPKQVLRQKNAGAGSWKSDGRMLRARGRGHQQRELQILRLIAFSASLLFYQRLLPICS